MEGSAKEKMSQSDAPNCGPGAVKRHKELPAWIKASGQDRTGLVGATQKWSHFQSWMLPDGALERSGAGALKKGLGHRPCL